MKKNICNRCHVYMEDHVGLNEVCLQRVGLRFDGTEELVWKIKPRSYCLKCANDMGIEGSGLLLVSNILYFGKVRSDGDWGEEAYDVVELGKIKNIDL